MCLYLQVCYVTLIVCSDLNLSVALIYSETNCVRFLMLLFRYL